MTDLFVEGLSPVVAGDGTSRMIPWTTHVGLLASDQSGDLQLPVLDPR